MEKIKNNQPLPIFLKKLILEISQIIEEEEFLLFGGAPIDYLLNGNTKFNDLDIAIKKTNKREMNNLKEKLVKKGFKVLISLREYTVQKTKKVYLMYAKNEKLSLDICFLDDFELAPGPFNLDNLYCRYPELDFVDNLNSIDGITKKIIIPTRSLQSENPYLLLSRFIRLCSKYKIYPLETSENKNIFLEIKKEIESGKYSNNSDQFASCIDSIIKSILESENRRKFIENIVNGGIIGKTMPELHRSLKLAVGLNYNNLNRVDNKKNLIILLINLFTNKNDKKSFLKLINCLKSRSWDLEYTDLFDNIKL